MPVGCLTTFFASYWLCKQMCLQRGAILPSILQSSQPVADESIKVSAEPAWQICGIFLLRYKDSAILEQFLTYLSSV